MKRVKHLNFKRAIILTIAISFIVSTLGINVAIGYCPMKQSYSFSFLKKSIPCCCSKPHKGNCCKSNQIVFKKITDHYYPSTLKFISHQAITIPKNFEFKIIEPITYYYTSSRFKYKPPIPHRSLNILYRSILI